MKIDLGFWIINIFQRIDFFLLAVPKVIASEYYFEKGPAYLKNEYFLITFDLSKYFEPSSKYVLRIFSKSRMKPKFQG